MDNSWKDFILCDSPNAGKMYGLVKTHKANNRVRIITSGESVDICSCGELRICQYL